MYICHICLDKHIPPHTKQDSVSARASAYNIYYFIHCQISENFSRQQRLYNYI